MWRLRTIYQRFIDESSWMCARHMCRKLDSWWIRILFQLPKLDSSKGKVEVCDCTILECSWPSIHGSCFKIEVLENFQNKIGWFQNAGTMLWKSKDDQRLQALVTFSSGNKPRMLVLWWKVSRTGMCCWCVSRWLTNGLEWVLFWVSTFQEIPLC